jgi:mannitol/fructose-specific phosphotransferase system IIA component (Ntr-type)
MKLADIVLSDAVIPQLQAADRNGVIREMVEVLTKSIGLSVADTDAVAKAVMLRENQGSTGLGKGVAVPHVKHKAIRDVTAAYGRSDTGVDFAALDRAPVFSIFLLLSPADKPDEHLAAMEKIFKSLQHDKFRRFLRQAATREEIIDLIAEADEIANT